MTGVVDAAVKSTVLFLAALAVDRLLARRVSAAVRHLVLVAALIGAVALPVLSAWMPGWQVASWVPSAGEMLVRMEVTGTAGMAEQAAAGELVAVRPAGEAIPWMRLAGMVWLVGVGVVLARMAAGACVVRRMVGRARPGAQAGVRMGAPGLMPMTCGLLRPVVLLPSEAEGWSEEHLKMVLLHEFAHVARRDALWQALGRVACAFYWPHPLAWLVEREALRSRERAADDFVLRAGVKASEYATRLLEIARTLSAPRLARAQAMARPSQLEGRLLAILETNPRRGPASWRAVTAVALASCGAAVLLSAAQVGGDPALMSDAGKAAVERFDFDGAVKLYREALAAATSRYGAGSVEAARVMVKLAGALETDREPEGGLRETAIGILRRSAPLDPALAEALYRAGIALHREPTKAKARELYLEALKVAEANGDARLGAKLNHVLGVMSGSGDQQTAYFAEEARLRAMLPPAPDTRANFPSPGTHSIKETGVSAPKLVSKTEPAYSEEARVAKLQGVVVLMVEVDPQGAVEVVRVVRSLGLGLDEEAVRAVRAWRFEPGNLNGEPVPVAATIETNFRLL